MILAEYKIKYPHLLSVMRPVPHSDSIPLSNPPVNKDIPASLDQENFPEADPAKSVSSDGVSIYKGTSVSQLNTQEDQNVICIYLSVNQRS